MKAYLREQGMVQKVSHGQQVHIQRVMYEYNAYGHLVAVANAVAEATARTHRWAERARRERLGDDCPTVRGVSAAHDHPFSTGAFSRLVCACPLPLTDASGWSDAGS